MCHLMLDVTPHLSWPPPPARPSPCHSPLHCPPPPHTLQCASVQTITCSHTHLKPHPPEEEPSEMEVYSSSLSVPPPSELSLVGRYSSDISESSDPLPPSCCRGGRESEGKENIVEVRSVGTYITVRVQKAPPPLVKETLWIIINGFHDFGPV